MQRNNVLDIAKSWAIFSVLVYHVVRTFVYWECVGSFIDTYFLTLFFFVSGLLSKDVKLANEGWCKKQVTHLLLPFLSCWLLYRLFLLGLHGTPIISKGALDDAKGGYWFILVLYVFNIMLYGLVRVLLIARMSSNITKLVILTLPFGAAATLCVLLPYEVAGILSLMSIRRYWLFFAYGYAITNIWQCASVLRDKRFGVLSCCVYIPMALFYTIEVVSIKSNFDFIFWTFTNIFAIHSLLYIFYVLHTALSFKIDLES